jgi:hypothetical protein
MNEVNKAEIMWTDHIEGTFPADDLRRAFVMGAQWWELQSTGGTMWQSDRNLAEERAEELFPNGKPPNQPNAERMKNENQI